MFLFCSRILHLVITSYLVCDSIKFSSFSGPLWEFWELVFYRVQYTLYTCSPFSDSFTFFLTPASPASVFPSKVTACKFLPLALSSRKSGLRPSCSRFQIFEIPTENLGCSSYLLLIGRSEFNFCSCTPVRGYQQFYTFSSVLLSKSPNWQTSQGEKGCQILGSDSWLPLLVEILLLDIFCCSLMPSNSLK